MKVMSFNLLCAGRDEKQWFKRIPLVVRTIRKAEPDTFGVQEAHIGWMRALRGAFPDYAYVGIGRDNGKNLGEFSAVFYKKDKYKLLDSGHFWLSEHPERPGKGWDAVCIRICSYAKLQDKASGAVFVHMNTHLDHVGVLAMQNGAELIAARAAEFGDIPVLLTGDFNVTPDSVPCQAIRDGGFSDARDCAKTTDHEYTFHAYEPDNDAVHSIIDYIFVKGVVQVRSLKVIRKKIDGLFPSDHFPVLADIEIC